MPRTFMAGVDTPQVEAFREVMRAEDALRRLLDRELREERGLSLSEYVVLLTLRYAPGGSLPVGALCGEVQLTRSGVTRLVDRMEAAGTVERMAAPRDRRTVRAAITAHGRDELRKAWPVHRRGIEQHFGASLSDAEAATLRDLLRRVVPEIRLTTELVGVGAVPPGEGVVDRGRQGRRTRPSPVRSDRDPPRGRSGVSGTRQPPAD